MRKELPINMSDPVVTECWNYCRLAAMLARGNKEWYAAHFWEVNVYDGFIGFYYEIDSEKWCMPNYDGVIKSRRVDMDKDIIFQIEEAISVGDYPILYVHNENNSLCDHEILVFGYDSDKCEIKCLVYYGQPNYWIEISYKYDETRKLFYDEIELLKKDEQKLVYCWGLGYPGSIIHVEENAGNKVDFNLLYRTVRRMLYSGFQGATGVKMYHSEEERWGAVHRGIEIYKLYYVTLIDLIKEDKNYLHDNSQVINSMFKVLESKRQIRNKLAMLSKNKYIADVDDILAQLDILYKYLRRALTLVEKTLVAKSDRYLDSIFHSLQNAEVIDKCILEQLLIVFEGEIIRELKGDLKENTKP